MTYDGPPIEVPGIPLPIYVHLRNLSNREGNIVSWRIKEGDYVKAGQVIGEFLLPKQRVVSGFLFKRVLKPVFYAPFDGIITHVSNVEYTEYPPYRNWDEVVKAKNWIHDYDNFRPFFSLRSTNPKQHGAGLGSVYKPIMDLVYWTTDTDLHPDTNDQLWPNNIIFHVEMVWSKYIAAGNNG